MPSPAISVGKSFQYHLVLDTIEWSENDLLCCFLAEPADVVLTGCG